MRQNRFRFAPLAALLALVTASLAPARAQEWRGQGRAHGVVQDLAGEPLPGARVILRPGEGPGVDAAEEHGPEPVAADREGRWTVPLLAPGIWRIRVEAPDFQPAEGRLVVPAEGTGESVRVRLRSLDEVSPAAAESDPARSVRQWIEKGDVFLDQGRPAEARGEYEKALRTPDVLGPAERAQVLETVARTHFLEGDRAEAERALRAALVLVPEEERVRQLYTVLLQGDGRGAEAEALLKRLDREPEALERELAGQLSHLLEPEADAEPVSPSPLPDRPLVPPEPGRRGRFRTAFTERHPLSDPGVVLDRYGSKPAEIREHDPSGGRYELAEETFEVYVPDGYRPGAGYGLVVWVSPVVTGGTDDAELEAVLDELRLLWVGANRAGNPRFTWNRLGLALDAAHNMTALYDLDPERVVVAGYSGGGRLASALGLLFPETFRGSFSLYGASYFRDLPVPDRPGAHWPASFPEPPRSTLARVKKASRFVLLTGERDFNRAQTLVVSEAMEEDGFEHVTYLEIPGAHHYTSVGATWWERALAALAPPSAATGRRGGEDGQ